MTSMPRRRRSTPAPSSRSPATCHPTATPSGRCSPCTTCASRRASESVASWSEPFVVAPHYTFLPGLDLATKPARLSRRARADGHLRLRFARPARRAGGAGQAPPASSIVLDHHVTNDRYGSINVVDPDAAATAVVVRRLARRLGWALNRDAAICLYTGLVTDTGRFQYSNTTPEVFELAAELARFDLPIADDDPPAVRVALASPTCSSWPSASRGPSSTASSASWPRGSPQVDLDRFGVEHRRDRGPHRPGAPHRRGRRLVRAQGDARRHQGVAALGRPTSTSAPIAMPFGGGGHRAAAGFTSTGPCPSSWPTSRPHPSSAPVHGEHSRCDGDRRPRRRRQARGLDVARRRRPLPAASSARSGSATRARSTPTPPACCWSASVG